MAAEIIPGILSHNLEEYVAKLELVEKSGSPWVHIDIMDGQLVPNISVMPHELMSISTKLSIEAHLMTFNPERYFSDLTVSGVSRVLLHREAYDTLEQCAVALKNASDYFSEVGLALNPDTPIEDYRELPITVIQCMGVHPGASGQALIDSTYATIKAVRQQSSLTIAVDGGVSEENIKDLQKAGATRFVLSSHLFVTNNVTTNLRHFTQLLGGV